MRVVVKCTLSRGIWYWRSSFHTLISESLCDMMTSPREIVTSKHNQITCYTLMAYRHKTHLVTFLGCDHVKGEKTLTLSRELTP